MPTKAEILMSTTIAFLLIKYDDGKKGIDSENEHEE